MPGRTEHIQSLERLRGSRVISYITGDREYCHAQISDDAVRPFFDVLRRLGKVEKIDLFLYSRGGAVEVPWRIASALRQYSDSWSILIPFRANSAATLLALGADEIIFGKHGELGPIDPTQYFRPPGSKSGEGVSVEDVMAYLRFAKEEVGLSDQETLSHSLAHLSQNIGAVSLGSVHRIRSHIRDVAHRMLASQCDPLGEHIRETIVDTLATKVYAHGHAIGFQEAKGMSLPASVATDEVEQAMWNLLCAYEQDLKLREIPDTAGPDAVENLTIALVESTEMAFEFQGQFRVKMEFLIPPNLQININMPKSSDSNTDNSQETVQEFIQQINPEIERAVYQALLKQAPAYRIEYGFKGGKWVKIE